MPFEEYLRYYQREKKKKKQERLQSFLKVHFINKGDNEEQLPITFKNSTTIQWEHYFNRFYFRIHHFT